MSVYEVNRKEGSLYLAILVVSTFQISTSDTHKQWTMFGSHTNVRDQYFDLAIETIPCYKLYACCWTN